MNMSDSKPLVKINDDKYYSLIAKKKPHIQQAIQMWLTGKYKLNQIADETGYSYEAVRLWLTRDENIRAYITAYQEEEMILVKNKLSSSTTVALDKMIELCESTCEGIAIQAARDILDRTGLKPIQKVQKEITVNTYEDKIKELTVNIDDYEVIDE